VSVAIVAGALANKPGNGGEAWVRMSWVQAMEALGFEVYFVEQVRAGSCLDQYGRPVSFPKSRNRAFFDEVVRGFGLEGRAAVILDEGPETHGLSLRELESVAEDAVLLVNIGGHLTHPTLKDRVDVRAYVDIDPGFTQIWEADGVPGAQLEGHDHYFTIGSRIGTNGCPIPTVGLRWVPIRQPVVLDGWPESDAGVPGSFTTVASWRGTFGPVELDGRTLGLKVHEFRRFIRLPALAPGHFEIALQIHPADHADLAALHEHGWRTVDPAARCGDPWAFRRYIQKSGAEFSVAQGVYVATDCGWFSDRSVRYLASGKPVLVQDTGLEGVLPTGEGLLTFRTLEEAAEGAGRIARDYRAHARAARALAEEFFSPAAALSTLIKETGVVP
jgi:hypothetical protein